MSLSFRDSTTKQYTRNSNKVIMAKILGGMFMFLMGALFLGVIVFVSNKEKGYVETKGVVVDYFEKYDYEDNVYMYKEIVKYTVNGETYTVTGSASSTHPKKIGSVVKIEYDPNNPEKAVFGAKERNWIFGVVGTVLLLGGPCMFVVGIKDRIAYKRALNGYN